MKPNSWKWGAIVATAVLAQGGAVQAADQAILVNNVEVRDSAAATRVVIRTSGIPRYTVFKLSAPTRVVVDLQDVDVSGADLPASGTGAVTQVTSTQFDDAAGKIGRVMVGLVEGASYEVKAEGQTVVVTASKPTTPAVQAAAEEPTQPATRLLAVESRRRDGGLLIKVRTDGEPLRYEIKEVADPPRLVVDLFGLGTKLKRPVEVEDDNVKRVRIGKHEDKIRLVLDTEHGIPVYDAVAASDGLTLALRDELQRGPASSEVSPSTATTITDVQFEKSDGFQRLRIDVEGAYKEHIASDAPRMKIVELKAELPQDLARTLDATALGGPVRRISTFVDPDNPKMVRVAVDLRSEAEHKMWRDGKALYWDFRSASHPASPVATTAAGFSTQVQSNAMALAPAARRYKGKKITLDVKDADILNVLRLIADVSKLNIIAADNVKGNITIKLRNVPWDQALDVILKTKGLDMERNGGIIRVAPLQDLQQERDMRFKARKAQVESQPTTVKLLVVNYASASEMLPQVQKLLSTRGSATVDDRTNVIIVEDIKENLIQAQRLVRTLDTQTPQVLIETRIVEATTTFSRTLGVQWGGGLNMSAANGNPTGLVFPYNFGLAGAVDDPSAGTNGLPGGPPNYAVNFPGNAGGAGSAGVGMHFGSIGNVGNLSLRIAAAEAEGVAKIVSSPKIVTIDNKTAIISQGLQIPVMTVSAQGTQTQLINADLKLEVTPHVTTDGSVLLKVQVSNNVPNFGQAVLGVPTIEKKEAKTEVLLYDGDTSVIGGIYTRKYDQSYAYTPLLGKIPLLGWLFKSTVHNDERRELLAFLTPRIVNRRSAMVDAEMGNK